MQERLLETTKKLVDVETHYEESERVRKVVDAKSLSCDDKFEMQEYQLVEGKSGLPRRTHVPPIFIYFFFRGATIFFL